MNIYNIVYSLQSLKQLLLLHVIKWSDRFSFLILFLKIARVDESLCSLLSFDHKNGPTYLMECLP